MSKTAEETNTAKLRNLLSPLYGLPSTVLILATRVDEKSKEILIQMCETAIVNTEKIKPLLTQIEDELSDTSQQLAKREKTIQSLKEEVEGLKERNDSYNEHIGSLLSELTTQAEEIKKLKEQLNEPH